MQKYPCKCPEMVTRLQSSISKHKKRRVGVDFFFFFPLQMTTQKPGTIPELSQLAAEVAAGGCRERAERGRTGRHVLQRGASQRAGGSALPLLCAALPPTVKSWEGYIM